jgi:hypothetical protein
MKVKIQIPIFAAAILALIVSVASAQEEQWLQYRSEREARRILDDTGSSRPRLESEPPEGVELPQFEADEQFFARWSTPMAESGGLWIALDRAHEHGLWDRLFIDSDGDGHLADETAMEAYRTDRYSAYFGPVKVVFETEEGPITYHLSIRFYQYRESSRRIYVYPGCWYEGPVNVAGQTKHCVLIDYNVNGTFNDQSLDSGDADRIRIGPKHSRDTRFVGNYIEVDGKLYRTDIARDGAFIKLSAASDVPYGTVQLPETITEFAGGGENGLFTRKPENGLVKLPVGKYKVDHWVIQREDEKGRDCKLEGRYFSGDSGVFEVTDAKETGLSIGEPVRCSLSVNRRGEHYEYSKSVRGQLGEYVSITCDGRRMTERAKLHVKDKTGTFDRTYPIPDQ